MFVRDIANSLSSKRKQKIRRSIATGHGYYQKLISRKFGYESFISFLQQRLHIQKRDRLMVHSSFGALQYWNLSPFDIIQGIRDVIGPDGTLVMPTFPTTDTEKYVCKKKPFHVSRTPSQTGLLTEIFRRQKDVIRSKDPIRPFAAVGKDAEALVCEHHLSPSSYDRQSPLYKLAQLNGKVIGLGAPLHNLTLVHTIEALMKDRFPIDVFHQDLYYD